MQPICSTKKGTASEATCDLTPAFDYPSPVGTGDIIYIRFSSLVKSCNPLNHANHGQKSIFIPNAGRVISPRTFLSE
jgi:hypothetical protein